MAGDMEIRGNGPPLVLVPGMQGRWEWMTPTVEALARRFRVGTYSLCGEPGAPPLEPSYAGDLERLVPPENTPQYRRYLPRTTVARLEGTGHMGTVTRAATFAALVGEFVGTHG